MPKLSKPDQGNECWNPPPLDSNGPKPKGGYKQVAELSFVAYGFVGINKTRWPKDTSYPDFICEFINIDSICSSVDGVLEWRKYNCPNQQGTVMRVQVLATEVCNPIGKTLGK